MRPIPRRCRPCGARFPRRTDPDRSGCFAEMNLAGRAKPVPSSLVGAERACLMELEWHPRHHEAMRAVIEQRCLDSWIRGCPFSGDESAAVGLKRLTRRRGGRGDGMPHGIGGASKKPRIQKGIDRTAMLGFVDSWMPIFQATRVRGFVRRGSRGVAEGAEGACLMGLGWHPRRHETGRALIERQCLDSWLGGCQSSPSLRRCREERNGIHVSTSPRPAQ